MIVTSLGYGYVAKYLLKKIASDGVKCIGVTDNIKYIKKKKYRKYNYSSQGNDN